MTSVDKYLNRTYDRRNYNCGHFVADVWEDLTGQDIRSAISGLVKPTGQGRAILKDLRIFKKLHNPESPCIVFLSPARGDTHVGVYLRGRVLHIRETGVSFQLLDIAASDFSKIRFYTC